MRIEPRQPHFQSPPNNPLPRQKLSIQNQRRSLVAQNFRLAKGFRPPRFYGSQIGRDELKTVGVVAQQVSLDQRLGNNIGDPGLKPGPLKQLAR